MAENTHGDSNRLCYQGKPSSQSTRSRPLCFRLCWVKWPQNPKRNPASVLIVQHANEHRVYYQYERHPSFFTYIIYMFVVQAGNVDEAPNTFIFDACAATPLSTSLNSRTRPEVANLPFFPVAEEGDLPSDPPLPSPM